MSNIDITTSQEQLRNLRVLVVDNDPKMRQLHARLLQAWQCHPLIAEGEGEELDTSAITLAKSGRCQLALVDMRLRDDTNPRDWSGLALAPQLAPTVTIIVSGLGDRQAVRGALKTDNVYDFVAKEDGPEELAATMAAAARELALGQFRVPIIWSDGLSSAEIRRQLFSKRPEVPDDEADDVISRLFGGHNRVALSLIADQLDLSERVSAPRGMSRVFLAAIDTFAANLVVKLSRQDKIQRELENYGKYVQHGLRGNYRPEKFGEAILWDIGAVAYSYIGASTLGMPGESQTFTSYYRSVDNAAQIIEPLRHFFGENSWGNWYNRDVTLLNGSLFNAYDAVWKGQLGAALINWHGNEQQRAFPYMQSQLINPTRWLAGHVNEAQFVAQPRQAVTHGDLHGDNLFVSPYHAWPIDFERTGPGPILRDIVEFTQDIVTRIAQFKELDLPVLYALAVAMCAPETPKQPMPLPTLVRDHPEALKAFQVVQELLNIAVERADYGDRRELLWGWLLNCMFVATLLSENEIDPRRTRTLLLASVICHRLERWRLRAWPTSAMPAVEFSGADTQPKPGGGKAHRAAPNTASLSGSFFDEEDRRRQIEELHQLYTMKRRRLFPLKRQAAIEGSGVDPSISIEITDLQQEIAGLLADLKILRGLD